MLQEGKTANAETIEAGAAANSGAASSLKTIISTILTGECPSSPSLAGQARRAIGGLLRTGSSTGRCNGRAMATESYLMTLHTELDAHSLDAEAVEREDRQIEVTSERLERAIEYLDGVYVYTFPGLLLVWCKFRTNPPAGFHRNVHFRTMQKIDTERILLKIGKIGRFGRFRIRAQQRAINMPEDPWTLRVCRSATLTPDAIEGRFHMVLAAAGHGRGTGRRAGPEWLNSHT